MVRWPASVYRKFRYASAALRQFRAGQRSNRQPRPAALHDLCAMGQLEVSAGLFHFQMRFVSQVRCTSPSFFCANVTVARAPESSTGTCW